MDAKRLLRNLACLVVLTGGVAGCQQGFDDAVFLICQSPLEAGAEADQDADPAARAAAASRWIARHVDNQEARAFFASLAPLSPNEKAAQVREVATRIGLDSCPVADLWEPGGSHPAPSRSRLVVARP